MISGNGYNGAVRRVAEEGLEQNCASARWHDGWLAYKAAADEHETQY
jgi:hypothetical protein